MPFSSSPLTSLNTTICGEKHSRAMFKWRFDMACTGCHKPNKLLTQCLGRHGYFEVQHTPSCWKHISCPIWFNLCVENFGIKNIGDENLNHLFKAPHTETYEIVEDWASSIYWGIRLELGVVHSVRFQQDLDRTWPKVTVRKTCESSPPPPPPPPPQPPPPLPPQWPLPLLLPPPQTAMPAPSLLPLLKQW